MEPIHSSYLFQFSLTGYTIMISILGLVCLSETVFFWWGVTAKWRVGEERVWALDTLNKDILVEVDDAEES